MPFSDVRNRSAQAAYSPQNPSKRCVVSQLDVIATLTCLINNARQCVCLTPSNQLLWLWVIEFTWLWPRLAAQFGVGVFMWRIVRPWAQLGGDDFSYPHNWPPNPNAGLQKHHLEMVSNSPQDFARGDFYQQKGFSSSKPFHTSIRSGVRHLAWPWRRISSSHRACRSSKRSHQTLCSSTSLWRNRSA